MPVLSLAARVSRGVMVAALWICAALAGFGAFATLSSEATTSVAMPLLIFSFVSAGFASQGWRVRKSLASDWAAAMETPREVLLITGLVVLASVLLLAEVELVGAEALAPVFDGALVFLSFGSVLLFVGAHRDRWSSAIGEPPEPWRPRRWVVLLSVQAVGDAAAIAFFSFGHELQDPVVPIIVDLAASPAAVGVAVSLLAGSLGMIVHALRLRGVAPSMVGGASIPLRQFATLNGMWLAIVGYATLLPSASTLWSLLPLPAGLLVSVLLVTYIGPGLTELVAARAPAARSRPPRRRPADDS